MTGDNGRDRAGGVSSDSGNSGIVIVYALVVLYALCYQLQSPIEPFLVERLLGEGVAGGSAAGAERTYAKIKSFFSVAQSVGSLFFGALLDRYGVKTGLVINFLACAACYRILSAADTVWMLYASRLPGVAMAGFLCAQTAVVKLTVPGERRLVALGRLTSAYTVGGVLGPYIGGRLGSAGDYYVGARWAARGSLLAAALVFALPSTVPGKEVGGGGAPAKTSAAFFTSPRQFFRALRGIPPVVISLLAVKVATGVANSMSSSVQPLVLRRLGADEASLGATMSAQFAFGGLANAFLLGPVSAAAGGSAHAVVRNCLLAGAALHLLQALVYGAGGDVLLEGWIGRGAPYVALAVLRAVFQYSLSTSITVEASALVPRDVQGMLVGVEHCLYAVAHGLGPMIGVRALDFGGMAGSGIACAFVYGLVFLMWTQGTKAKLSTTKNG